MEDDSDQLLEDLRKSFVERRNRLRILQTELDGLILPEQDEFKQTCRKVIEEYAYFMTDIYTRLEETLISNFALKDQLDLLKDIVIQLPGVKNNPKILQDIERMFKKYDKSY